jgi:radical SAM superfamily enzyme YgiQ (UPF0313 family)
MKITLINPPIEDFYVTGIRRQPLGLLYIAAALSAAGHNPSLLNCHSGKKSIMELPAEFSYLKPYMNNPDPDLRFPYKNYTHYGMSWQEIDRQIKDSPSDIYFISSLFTTYYRETELVIELIRRHVKNAYITVGGYHASLYPEYYLNDTGADFVICGEGEIASVALVRSIVEGGPLETVSGLVFRDNGVIKKNSVIGKPDVSLLAYPSRELLLERDFKAYKKNFISLISSRGCPNRCSFCTGKIIWGNGRREREAEDVMNEIRECMEKYGAEIINFEDDNLFPTKKRAHELLELLIRERGKGSVYPELTAMNGISLEQVDDEIIMLMKRAGFTELNISLVTYSENIQRSEGRPFSSEKFRSIAESARRSGMNVRGYFILGLPGQSQEEINETISFLKSLDVKVFPSVYYNIYSSPEEWKMQRSSAFYNENELLSRDDLFRSFNRCFSVQD